MGTFQAPVEDHLILPARVSLTGGEARVRQLKGRSIADPVAVRLVIDTGATRTTLSPEVIRHLNPSSGHDVRVITPSAPLISTLFWIRIDFPETRLTAFEHVQVARLEMPPALRQFDGLLGRDLLRRWDEFRYQGRRGRYLIHDTPGFFDRLRRWL